MADEGGRVALITGATGITGRNLILHLEQSKLWKEIYGLSRRPLDFGSKVKHLKVDMNDASLMEKQLQQATHTTHLFYCAYTMLADYGEEAVENAGKFIMTVEMLEKLGAPLKFVFFMSGTKWYGVHLAPNKTPFREEDPRSFPPHLYYDMEDYCIRRKREGAPWTWTSLRPNPVCGFSTGSAMNITNTIAVYAVLCKELGLPFRFPGTTAAYNALLEVCDANLLACGTEWLAEHEDKCGQSFNISNGDVFRWSEVWPKIAAYFDVAVAEPQPVSLTKLMAYHEGVWNSLVERHGLQKIPYNQLATWGFGDWVFAQTADWFATVQKLRRAGFQEMNLDSPAEFLRQFDEMRAAKIIP